RHEQARAPALAPHLLVRPRPAGRPAEGLVGQIRERRSGTARVHAPRTDEFAGGARPMEGRSGRQEGGLNLFAPLFPAMTERRRQTARNGAHAENMGTRGSPVQGSPLVPRLYLVTPPVETPDAAAQ